MVPAIKGLSPTALGPAPSDPPKAQEPSSLGFQGPGLCREEIQVYFLMPRAGDPQGWPELFEEQVGSLTPIPSSLLGKQSPHLPLTLSPCRVQLWQEGA